MVQGDEQIFTSAIRLLVYEGIICDRGITRGVSKGIVPHTICSAPLDGTSRILESDRAPWLEGKSRVALNSTSLIVEGVDANEIREGATGRQTE